MSLTRAVFVIVVVVIVEWTMVDTVFVCFSVRPKVV